MPNADDFRRILGKYFQEGEQEGKESLAITAGELHRRVGGYPGGSHSMPTCCSVMRQLMQKEDELIYAPPSGKGAKLEIRYSLPRQSSVPMTKPLPKPRTKASPPTLSVKVESIDPIETVKGKVVCFIPCCGAKTPSGITKDNQEHKTYLPEAVTSRLVEARKQGLFNFDSAGPETTALELYTGSPYRTFAPIRHDLYQAMHRGNFRLYIISAGYGVIDAREAIHNYDEEMKGKTAGYWKDHGLQNEITEILMDEKPDRFYGFFAAQSDWSHSSSKYRYFFSEGGKKAISKGLDVTQAGCFYRLDGRGVGAILDGLGRTFVEQFKDGFNSDFAVNVERNLRRDGNITIAFDRFR